MPDEYLSDEAIAGRDSLPTHGVPAERRVDHRLSNLEKLYHVPVFAVRKLIESRAPGQKLSHLRHAELVKQAAKATGITEADIEDLYEDYRYGRRLSLYLYLLPGGLSEPNTEELQEALDELATQEYPELMDEIAAGADYETETIPDQVILLDKEEIDGICEVRFRYFVNHRFLNTEEQADQVVQTRYGFLWLDIDLGYLVILSRDEPINRLLIRALSESLLAIPLPVRFPKELLDQHFPIERAKRLAYYDPGTGVRRSISGRGLWQKAEDEITAREQQYARPGSLYDEEMAGGVIFGLGVTASKGKIYFTKTLPTSLVRGWARQRLPDLVHDLKSLRENQPESFHRSLEAINRMRVPAVGKAATIAIVEALLQTEREDLTSVTLPQSAAALYDALAGKYFSPYLRTQCSKCDETAELCPFCESHTLDFGEQDVICKECGAVLSDKDAVVLRCMNGHFSFVPKAEAFSIAPNHWLLKRMTHIFAEVGRTWDENEDYFHIEDSTLYRLKKGEIYRRQLPQVVQNYISNFWDPVNGQVHAGSGDIVIDSPALQTGLQESPQAKRQKKPQALGMIKTYRNFDLRMRGSAMAGYTVEAAVSGGGSVPPQPLILPHNKAFVQQLNGVVHQTAKAEDVRAVGEVLFKAMFPARVLKLWVGAVGSLEEDEGLRITLRIDRPELMVLPWELIRGDEYIGLRLRFPIVRYVDLPDPPRPVAVQPPLRVLVAVSQPEDARPLNVDAELTSIRKALAQLPGKVEMDVLDPALRDELLARLRRGYHVLHFIGHGVFRNGEGYLILEDSDRLSDRVSASLLGQLVADSSLRLAILNACETSVTGPETAFGGVAHQMVRTGMPAVVAMQQNIPDPTAVAFSREFYGALADGWPVDAAVQEGRRGIITMRGNGWSKRADWAIPTLYMRAPDGIILGIEDRVAGAARERTSEREAVISHATPIHGPVHGSVHPGSGNIDVAGLQYGANADD